MALYDDYKKVKAERISVERENAARKQVNDEKTRLSEAKRERFRQSGLGQAISGFGNVLKTASKNMGSGRSSGTMFGGSSKGLFGGSSSPRRKRSVKKSGSHLYIHHVQGAATKHKKRRSSSGGFNASEWKKWM